MVYMLRICLSSVFKTEESAMSVEGRPKEGELAYVLIGTKRDTKGETELNTQHA